MNFTHLHTHTEYSVLDGHGKIKDYVAAAKEDGQTALAITDHGSIAGAVDFYLECREAGIKPLIGCELYVDVDSRDEKKFPYHLTVIAKDLQGYRDLIRVNTRAHKDFYYRPRVDLRALMDEGMLKHWIVLTGCPSSYLSELIKTEKMKQAKIFLKGLQKASGSLAIECMYHVTDSMEFRQEQNVLLHGQFDLAEATKIPLVLTNDCHYVFKEDEAVHQGFLKKAEGRVHGIEFDGEGFYLKTAQEMHAVAEYLEEPQAAENSWILSQDGDLEIPEIDKPSWYVPAIQKDPLKYLEKICKAALKEMPALYKERYDHEISVIKGSEPILNSYLVAYDLIRFCRESGIPATGRGSMAGSLISYLLGITSEDPVFHGLNFKRAVNPARLTIPDFDIDVSSRRRDEVLTYIAKKYPHSMPIASYSERGVKGATRMVLRSLNYTVERTNELAKELGDRGEPDLSVLPPEVRPVIQGYLGLYANMTVHPAGILISGEDKPLDDLIPMAWVASSKKLVTQFDMYVLKKIDMFKLDVLGVATLDALADMERLSGVKPPIEYNDEEVFKLLSKGAVCEIFQMDGFAARSAIRELGINNFEDIVAINALVRPGASQFIPAYRVGNPALIDNYPPLSTVLNVTRGLILYQEQVMEIAAVLADFDDLLQDDIKEAIKYFRAEVFAELEPAFMKGCAKNGHDGSMIWEAIKSFAGYAFNKAHAVTYAATAYKMAWFKRWHPAAFYAAVYDKSDAPTRVILESLRLGVQWELPDINLSGADTALVGDKIVLGLTAIKGIGRAVADAVVAARDNADGCFPSQAVFEGDIPKQKCNIKHKSLLAGAGALRTVGVPADTTTQADLLGFHAVITNPEVVEQITIYEPNRVGGFIISTREHVTKKDGKEMGFLTLINGAGEFSVTLFAPEWKKFKKALKGKPEMLPVIITGQNSQKGFVGYGGELVEYD